jgi:hypothetical protein
MVGLASGLALYALWLPFITQLTDSLVEIMAVERDYHWS